jgi:hypothetical protein
MTCNDADSVLRHTVVFQQKYFSLGVFSSSTCIICLLDPQISHAISCFCDLSNLDQKLFAGLLLDLFQSLMQISDTFVNH